MHPGPIGSVRSPDDTRCLGSAVDLWRHWTVARDELTPIQELLPSVLANLARSSGNARHLKPAWDRIVGAGISRHASPVQFQGDVLVIEVSDAGWARELTLREPEIRARVAAALGRTAALKLTFRPKG